MNFLRKLYVRPPNLKHLKPGEAGERWVAYLYERAGHKILARNYAIFSTKKLGELDIVCRRGRSIIVVEVRTRTSEQFMTIEETINFHKQNYLRRMSKLFMQNHPNYQGFDLQIDIAAVLLEPVDNIIKSVKIIENAIEDSQ